MDTVLYLEVIILVLESTTAGVRSTRHKHTSGNLNMIDSMNKVRGIVKTIYEKICWVWAPSIEFPVGRS